MRDRTAALNETLSAGGGFRFGEGRGDRGPDELRIEADRCLQLARLVTDPRVSELLRDMAEELLGRCEQLRREDRARQA
jgi:hypothetical protein